MDISNGFLDTIHYAFCNHYDFELNADTFWMTIMQGFAIHINENAKKFQSIFVQHQGKKEIIIITNEFIKGNKNNDWESTLDDFSTQIKKYIGDEKHTLFQNNFSTTGKNEKAVSEIILMDTVKAYFSYTTLTFCGIPSVRLLGTKEDWKKLVLKTKQLHDLNKEKKMGLDEWLDKILKLVKDIYYTYENTTKKKECADFWKSFYKYEGGSGGDKITGWIAYFYPYSYNRNEYTLRNLKFRMHMMYVPKALSCVPFVWKYYNQTYKMLFMGGMIGPCLNLKTNAVRSKCEWFVCEEKEEK